MAKKKQPDFQPTKLRVGKHLPKGRNVTNTAFKSKKIITKDQKLKTSADNSSLNDLTHLTHHTNVAMKTDALRRIGRYILANDSSLPAYFAEILKATGKLFLDFNPKVRYEALQVIKTAADILSDSQMSGFMHVLTSHINCMMTHISLPIKKGSLDLLSFLLKTHPGLICHSTNLLNNLLNMISSVKVQRGDTTPLSQKKRKLDDNISTSITSVEWRDQVMKIIAEFLEKLVESYEKQEQPREGEQEVHYDGVKPLFVQLYAGGGLTPAKLDFTPNLKSKGRVTEELKKFFSEIVSVASDIITEETAGLNVSSDHNILRPDNVEHLNSVTQVLCRIADWYNLDSQTEDHGFILEMSSILRKKLMKGFCYRVHDSKKMGRKHKEISCSHLNLGIGSLYCFFCLGRDSGSAALEREVLCLVTDVLNKAQYQDLKTTSFILKILKCFLRVLANSVGEGRNQYNEEFRVIFDHLCEMAGRSRDRALAKEIQSFFIELSLDYDYKFLLDLDLLDSWTNYTFRQIKRMYTEKNANKKLLKCINLMCSREYPPFMRDLELSEPLEIVDYLKFDDEDYQWTIINLITHMTNLPPNFLNNVARFILVEDQLSLKTVSKLIRSLYNRFSDETVSIKEFTEFCRFVLNVAFDPISVGRVMDKYTADYFEGNKFAEEEEDSGKQQEEYSEELIHLLFYVQSSCVFTIVPSQQWERHSKILEVCFECLVVHRDRDVTKRVVSSFFHELMLSKRTLPVHSAMALLKLATPGFLFEEYVIHSKVVARLFNELLYCSLFYISIVTHKERPERCRELGVGQLQGVLNLNKEKAYTLSQLISGRFYDQGMDEVSLLHILRIIKFLRTTNKICAKDLMVFEEVFRVAEMYCSEDTEHRAYLAQIYELIQQ